MDSKKLVRFLRAVLSGDFDFEAPRHRTSSGVALFLAGLGAGVVVAMLFTPVSGEQLRSEVGDRAREGFETAKSKTADFVARQKAQATEKASSKPAEKSAS